MLSLTLQVVEKNVSLFICTITLSSLHEEFIKERKPELLHGLPLSYPQVSPRSTPQFPPEVGVKRHHAHPPAALAAGTVRSVHPPSHCSRAPPRKHSLPGHRWPGLFLTARSAASSHAGKATLRFLLMLRPAHSAQHQSTFCRKDHCTHMKGEGK